MPTPVRFPGGISTDQPWQPMAQYGLPDPTGFHTHFDDFDLFSTARYTTTATSAGTVAGVAADGGASLFTTNASTPLVTDIAAIQGVFASFSINTAKKLFFATRLRVSSAVNAAFNVGLINTTATPFAPTDGIYLRKTTGAANNITLVSAVGSVLTTVAIPTNAYTLADNTDIDLGFMYDARGNIQAFVGSGLFAYQVNSGTGAVNPNRGVVATLAPTSFTGVLLNPTLAIQSGTATSKTMQVDILFAAKER